MNRQRYIRIISTAWGVGGVLLLVGYAIVRLLPFAAGMFTHTLSWWQWLIFAAWGFYMAYSEGYIAFYKLFCPRAVARAWYLGSLATVTPTRRILAPLFCMGYFGAPRRRMITAYALTAGIITLIIGIHFVPQPWRGIIDGGVILGLASGFIAQVAWIYRALRTPDALSPINPEVR